MGVRGLSSFFDCNPQLTKSYKLHDCRVIIDGNNLVHFLYFSNKLDCIFGGDYYKFAEIIKKHISIYLECNIKPIIIFDGGYDLSDRKLRTVFERTKRRLTNVQHISKYGSCSEKVLPILAVEVMKNVLQSMNITFAQCDHEADEQLVLLANQYKCPVISQDSDFYIFDITHGFIRLDFIDDSVSECEDENGHKFKHLKCQIYSIDYFLSLFTGMSKKLLPLFSTLIGNDISHIKMFDQFFCNIQLPKFKGKLKVSQRHKKMIGLLTWLQDHTLEEAIEQVLSRLKLKRREQVKTVIKCAVDSYNAECCIILDSSENLDVTSLQRSVLKTYHGKSLPTWFIKNIRCCQISPFVLNTISLHRNFLPSQVEDMSLESSFKCSRRIRQIIYSILLTYDKDVTTTEFHNYVDEYDRRNGNLQKESVSIIEAFGCDMLPSLDKWDTLNKSTTKLCLLKVVGDDLKIFTDLPRQFQLLFSSVRFWLRNTSPNPPIEVLNAFILTNILFGISLPLISQQMNPSDKIHNVYVSDDNETDLQNLIKNVQYAEASLFYNNMKKRYFQKPQHNNANPIAFRIIHHFCQLQTCVLFLTYLNRLLFSPFENLKFEEYFNGTVFYNLTQDLMNRTSMNLFISQLLGQNSNLENLYFKIREKMLENMSENILVQQCCKSKTKKRSSNKKINRKVNNSNTSNLIDELKTLNLSIDPDVDVFL